MREDALPTADMNEKRRFPDASVLWDLLALHLNVLGVLAAEEAVLHQFKLLLDLLLVLEGVVTDFLAIRALHLDEVIL